jgi:hypothetical protein
MFMSKTARGGGGVHSASRRSIDMNHLPKLKMGHGGGLL